VISSPRVTSHEPNPEKGDVPQKEATKDLLGAWPSSVFSMLVSRSYAFHKVHLLCRSLMRGRYCLALRRSTWKNRVFLSGTTCGFIKARNRGSGPPAEISLSALYIYCVLDCSSTYVDVSAHTCTDHGHVNIPRPTASKCRKARYTYVKELRWSELLQNKVIKALSILDRHTPCHVMIKRLTDNRSG
jgi:hypothetical protein